MHQVYYYEWRLLAGTVVGSGGPWTILSLYHLHFIYFNLEGWDKKKESWIEVVSVLEIEPSPRVLLQNDAEGFSTP